jgi:hypothetical protein
MMRSTARLCSVLSNWLFWKRVRLPAMTHWKASSYRESNWARVEPLLRGAGCNSRYRDHYNYYTNLAVHLLQERLKKVSPASDAEFHYYPSGAHCHTPISQQELVTRMVDFMQAHSSAD